MIASENKQTVNVCLQGHGIVCGLTVQVNPNCDVELGGGTAITENGTVIHMPGECFGYYLKVPDNLVQKYFPHNWNEKNRANRTVLQLVPKGDYDPKTMDSLKQQNPKDLPTRNLLDDKIAVLLIPENDRKYFLLVSPSLLIEMDPDLLAKVKALSKNDPADRKSGIFNRPGQSKPLFVNDAVSQALRPYLLLPEIVLPRFGYKTLAIVDPEEPFGAANLQNPFLRIANFKDIFLEYKTILDDYIPRFCTVLEKLHELYGDQLSHKGKGYWTQYRDILVRKWQVFLREGECLFYIQYYYDWLSDLVKAYDELCAKLSAFRGSCFCGKEEKEQERPYLVIRLGPVLGGRSSYTPVNFRDYFQPAMINGDAAEQWNEIRFLHWRLMMMIWTFDLPQLRLDEKVLVAGRYLIPAKEFEDSTNYFERINTGGGLADLPLKFTPGEAPDTELGSQAIPYYYPLDADSPYSLHRYWNYRKTQTGQINRIRSYNANEGRDSYTHYRDTLIPQAFSLRNEPYLRAEGHIGKVTNIHTAANPASITPDWDDQINRFNLTANVLMVPVSQLNAFIAKNAAYDVATSKGIKAAQLCRIGLEHTGGIEQGQTLVMVYVDNGAGEQIDLNECRKDETPEVEAFTIVADFTVTCCDPLLIQIINEP